MAGHLSKKNVAAIVDEIIRWSSKIKWDDIRDISEEVTGHRYSKVALNKHDDIVTAYKINVSADHEQRGGKNRKSLAVIKAEERIEKLKAEIVFLKEVNNQLNEKFLVWLHNATQKGLTEADLEKPLPIIDRKRTED